jgi:hypothetical protein
MPIQTEQLLALIKTQPGINAARLTLVMDCDIDDLHAQLAALVAFGSVRLSNIELPGNDSRIYGYSVNLGKN